MAWYKPLKIYLSLYVYNNPSKIIISLALLPLLPPPQFLSSSPSPPNKSLKVVNPDSIYKADVHNASRTMVPAPCSAATLSLQ